jgi:hypothetical protein
MLIKIIIIILLLLYRAGLPQVGHFVKINVLNKILLILSLKNGNYVDVFIVDIKLRMHTIFNSSLFSSFFKMKAEWHIDPIKYYNYFKLQRK